MGYADARIIAVCPECGEVVDVTLKYSTLPVGLPLRRDSSPAWRGYTKCLRCKLDMSFEAKYTKEIKYTTIGETSGGSIG